MASTSCDTTGSAESPACPRRAEADTTHLWHTHISFYRDSRLRSKVGLFSPYFALPDTSTEDVVVIVVTVEKMTPQAFTSAVPNLRRFTATDELSPIDGPYSATVDAQVWIDSPGVPHGKGFLRLASGGSAGKYVLASEVTLQGRRNQRRHNHRGDAAGRSARRPGPRHGAGNKRAQPTKRRRPAEGGPQAAAQTKGPAEGGPTPAGPRANPARPPARKRRNRGPRGGAGRPAPPDRFGRLARLGPRRRLQPVRAVHGDPRRGP